MHPAVRFLTARKKIQWIILAMGLLSATSWGLQTGFSKPLTDSAQWFGTLLYQDPLETQALRIEKLPDNVEIVTRGSTTHPIIYVINRSHLPVEVEMRLVSAENVSTSLALPAHVIVPAHSDTPILSLWATNPKQTWFYLDSYQAVIGDPNAHHNIIAYRLPFKEGSSFPVTQGFGGSFSHTHIESYYAVDFAMPEGTPIHAARTGIIAEMNDSFTQGGVEDVAFVNRANSIRILHDDGTMAVYAHLGHHSVQVQVGDRVQTGQFIARSGNTGYSTGPHLHFAIQKNAGMQLITVPFEFQTGQGVSIIPLAGVTLTAFKE
jgi:hypothetical protein